MRNRESGEFPLQPNDQNERLHPDEGHHRPQPVVIWDPTFLRSHHNMRAKGVRDKDTHTHTGLATGGVRTRDNRLVSKRPGTQPLVNNR